jgi:hypothetical protein
VVASTSPIHSLYDTEATSRSRLAYSLSLELCFVCVSSLTTGDC